MSDKPLLRVGLYVDSLEQPRWIAQIIQEIQASDAARIVLVVENALKDERTTWQKIIHNRNYLLYAAYSSLDARLNHVEPAAEEPVDVALLLAKIPVLRVQPQRKKGYLDRFSDEDMAKIRAYELDVVLRFGFKILKGAALQTARYGVWSYHHGDNRVNRGQPAGFWEVMHGIRDTGVVLQVLSEELDGGQVMHRATSGTHPYSPHRNFNNILWRSVPFVLLKLRELYQHGTLTAEQPEISIYSHPLYKRPGNLEMLGLVVRLIGRLIDVLLLRTIFLYQWFLLYRVGPNAPEGSLHRFKRLVPPADRFWADPFVVAHEGRYTIFFEDFPYRTNRGIIAALDILQDSTQTEPVTVLERDYHLSYPFVFQYEGQWYMLPETMENRTIEVYRAVEFPLRWELHKVLMQDIVAVDTHLFEHNSLWWMFTNLGHNGSRFDEELYLFYADSPFGEWKPHPLNPVKSDAWSSRGAGAIFQRDGKLYRPAQNTTRRSRETLSVYQITRLDTENYEEILATEIQPNWEPNLLAVHTLNIAHNFTILDARARVNRLLYWRWKQRR
jgi:hypothetical protein